MAHVAGLGYAGVEIAPFTLARSVADVDAGRRRGIREAAAGCGLEVSAIHWVLVQTEGMHVTSPDAAVRRRTAEYFCQLTDFCADVGARRMVVGSPKQRNVEPGIGLEQARDWAWEVFRPAVARAVERGVVICFEPLAPSETNFINTAEEAVSFVRELGSAGFRVILDVKAMCSEAKPIPRIIAETGPWCAYFHANDRNLRGPGTGDVDFGPIARALRESGYDGWVSVEVFDFEGGPEKIARESLAYLRRVFGGV